MSNRIYKRGQVEWALWRHISGRNKDPKPPRVFLTRIKRLLELDRAELDSGTTYAFSDLPPPGKGADAGFTGFDSFCLALGLDLLDSGFKQSEVVFALRHMREDLKKQYRWIMKCPPHLRLMMAASDAPGDRPRFVKDGIEYADLRVFLVTQRIEIKEQFAKPDKKNPMIIKPKYFRGLEALTKELEAMGHAFRTSIVLELANTASAINQYLADAPEIRRGRP